MAVPNEGTQALPSDSGSRYHLGVFDGANYYAPRGDATNGMDVDVTRLPALPAGTNNIGDVDLASALPAGTNNIGDVDVLTLPAVTIGGSGKTLKRVAGTMNTNGNNTLVTGVSGKVLKVYSYAIQGQGTATAYLRNGNAGSPLTIPFSLVDKQTVGPVAIDPPNYLFKTSATTDLVLNISGAITIGYEVSYWDDDAS